MNDFGINLNQLEANLFNKDQQAKRNNINDIFLTHDANNGLRLRLATINNSNEQNYLNKDSLDLTNVYDSSTGKVSIKWMRGNHNGAMASECKSGKWEYNKNNNTYTVKDRKPLYTVDSSTPTVTLSSPFIWTGDNGKSCGFNYVPPNNSICIIGNKETGQPMILGYEASNPAVLYPTLKPGEVSISGYGNNFIHWSQSDKISIYCKSNKGELDKDDSDYIDNKDSCKKNVSDCELEININANDRFIEIIATENNGDPNGDYVKNNKYSRQPNGFQQSKIIITPNDVNIESSDGDGNSTIYQQTSEMIYRKVMKKSTNDDKFSEETIKNDSITFNTDNFKVNAKNIDLNNHGRLKDDVFEIDVRKFIVESKETEMNSSEETTIHSEDIINITVPKEPHPHPGKNYTINIYGCHINQTSS